MFRVLPCCWLLLFVACGDDSSSMDAGPDAPTETGVDAAIDGAEEMALPDGPRGDVLRVEESASWTIPALRAPVYVLRTEADVPHIYASNELDLRVAQGFVVARDRYFQIEAGRRLAQGRLAELIGDGALSGDLAARGRGMTKIAERLFERLTPEQLEIVQAYTNGVNAYIDAVASSTAEAPSELALLSLVLGGTAADYMEPLTSADLIAFAAVPVFQLGYETGDPVVGAIEDQLAEVYPDDDLRRNGARQDLFEPVRPLNDVSSAPGFGLARPSTALRIDRAPIARGPYRLPRSVERTMLARLNARNDAFEERFRGGRWNDFGSNAWATTTALGDGAAILSGDGHLPLSIAPLFYQLGLDTSVFGENAAPTTEMGLFFAGIAPMAVGTNGRVAWSQTYLRGDVTDWYGEELVLTEGVPTATRFRGEEQPLVVVPETVVVADVEALESVGRTETWDRYETFDGRMIAAIEGRPADATTTPGPGESLVNVQGEFVIPSDVDGDGVVSAVSFDYTGFDVSNILRALENMGDAGTVLEFRDATRELVTYAQNLVAADVEGNVYYGSYNAMPSRAHLPRDEDGRWLPGANPRGLIDGTEYGAFEVRLDESGMPDESSCDDAAETCLIPFDEWPSSLNPEEGFVLTANNDIANITTDGNFFNDPYYIGGPWNNGFRGETIRAELARLAEAGDINVASMQALQGNHTSVMGRRFVPYLIGAIDEARRIQSEDADGDDEARLLALYEENADAIDEVYDRLSAWLTRGAEAASGVQTFYATPAGTDAEDAVATMIFNQWWREHIAAIFSDEGLDFAFAADSRTTITRVIDRMWRSRGENTEGLASYDDASGESVFFDNVRTSSVVERSDEAAISALLRTFEKLSAAPSEPGVGGFGTADQSQWLWGLRHQVRFDSIIADFVGTGGVFGALAAGFSIGTAQLPLAEDIPDSDPRADLP
ncbi:MAG: penicillin acylase family protein, partial [Myxococcota bacterium]